MLKILGQIKSGLHGGHIMVRYVKPVYFLNYKPEAKCLPK